MLAAAVACHSRAQRFEDFGVPTPIEDDRVLVVGFLGGRDSWDDPDKGVNELAVKLRSLELPLVVETVENKQRTLALELIFRCFDRNDDGELDAAEKRRADVVLYGQSFGGAAVVKLARELEAIDFPVLLTVQIDSVGRDDAVIPPNVWRAANLYQDNGLLIRGENPIRARDPLRTVIIGNFRFDYSSKDVELTNSWFKRLFRVAHSKMDADADVWAKVEQLIVEAVRCRC